MFSNFKGNIPHYRTMYPTLWSPPCREFCDCLPIVFQRNFHSQSYRRGPISLRQAIKEHFIKSLVMKTCLTTNIFNPKFTVVPGRKDCPP